MSVATKAIYHTTTGHGGPTTLPSPHCSMAAKQACQTVELMFLEGIGLVFPVKRAVTFISSPEWVAAVSRDH